MKHPEKSPCFQAELPVPFDCVWTAKVTCFFVCWSFDWSFDAEPDLSAVVR